MRASRLEQLGFATYQQYIWSDTWKRTRERYYADPAHPRECVCGSTRVHLHHRTYERLGAEHPDDLFPLCPSCHATLHKYIASGHLKSDVHPLELYTGDTDEDQARRLAAARDEAAAQLAAPAPLNVLDRATIQRITDRADKIRAGREYHERIQGFKGRQRRKNPRRDDHARPEDMGMRTFDPTD